MDDLATSIGKSLAEGDAAAGHLATTEAPRRWSEWLPARPAPARRVEASAAMSGRAAGLDAAMERSLALAFARLDRAAEESAAQSVPDIGLGNGAIDRPGASYPHHSAPTPARNRVAATAASRDAAPFAAPDDDAWIGAFAPAPRAAGTEAARPWVAPDETLRALAAAIDATDDSPADTLAAPFAQPAPHRANDARPDGGPRRTPRRWPLRPAAEDAAHAAVAMSATPPPVSSLDSTAASAVATPRSSAPDGTGAGAAMAATTSRSSAPDRTGAAVAMAVTTSRGAASDGSAAAPGRTTSNSYPATAETGPADDALVGRQTRAAVGGAFGELSRSVAGSAPRTLEDVVREMMRPLLRDWLDANLTAIVEAQVAQEIGRLARQR